jgi:hypothetical protein
MMSGNIPPIGRRNLLGLAIVASVAVVPWWAANAQTLGDASAIAPIEQLDNALLAAMKAGESSPFDDRYRVLAPVVERVFDLDAVLAASIGLSWPTLSGGPEGGARSSLPPLYGLELRHELQQLQRPELPGLANGARSQQWRGGGEQPTAARRWFVVST